MNLTKSEIQTLFKEKGAENNPQKRAEIVDTLRKKGFTIEGMSGYQAPKEEPRRSVMETVVGGAKGGLQAGMRGATTMVSESAGGMYKMLNSLNPLSKADLKTRFGSALDGSSSTLLAPYSAITSAVGGSGWTGGPTAKDFGAGVAKTGLDALGTTADVFGGGVSKTGSGLMDMAKGASALLTGGDQATISKGGPQALFGKVIPGLLEAGTSPLAGALSQAPAPVQQGAEKLGEIFNFLPEQGTRALGFDPATEEGQAIQNALATIQDVASLGAGRLGRVGLQTEMGQAFKKGTLQSVQDAGKSLDSVVERMKESLKNNQVAINTQDTTRSAKDIIEGLRGNPNKTIEFVNAVPEPFKPLIRRVAPIENVVNEFINRPQEAIELTSFRTGIQKPQVETISKVYQNTNFRDTAKEIFETARKGGGQETNTIVGRKALEPMRQIEDIKATSSNVIKERMNALRENVVPTEKIGELTSSVDGLFQRFNVRRNSKGDLVFNNSSVESSPTMRKILSNVNEKMRPFRDTAPGTTRSSLGVEIARPSRELPNLTVGQLDTWRKDLFSLQDAINERSLKQLPKDAKTLVENARTAMLKAIDDQSLRDASEQFAIATQADTALRRWLNVDPSVAIDKLDTTMGDVLRRIISNTSGKNKLKFNEVSESLNRLGINYNPDELADLVRYNNLISNDIFPSAQSTGIREEVRKGTRGGLSEGLEKISALRKADKAVGALLDMLEKQIGGAKPGIEAATEFLEKLFGN